MHVVPVGSSMEVYDVEGHTPFHTAIARQSLDCINIILQLMPADTGIQEIPTASGLTPLMVAVQQGNLKVCKNGSYISKV